MQIESDELSPVLYSDPAYQKFMAAQPALHANHYGKGRLSRLIEEQYKKDLLRLFTDQGQLRVDIGCGTGSGFPLLGDPAKIIGIESNMNLLKECRKRYQSATLICCNMAFSPFRKHSFSTIFSMAMLEHVFWLEKAVEKMQNMLKDGGHAYVMIPTEGGIAYSTARWLITQRPNARIVGISPTDYLHAAKIDHCNTALAIESTLRKFFSIETRRFWPLRFGGVNFNLVISYRLKPLSAGSKKYPPT